MRLQIVAIVNLLFVVVSCAPSKSSSRSDDKYTTYDQKQTGDYNIQLHLKDFQIVALFGEDTLGAFGDYEYNYDYSDLTIKPHNSSTTTSKPLIETTASSTTTTKQSSTEITIKSQSSSTPVPSTTTQKLPETSSYAPLNSSSNNNKTVRSDDRVSTEKSQKFTSVTIVPAQQENNDQHDNSVANILNLGEILHYRKCPSGYSKDKRGRCRRTRRPGVLPYGITRFASNLAAKFKHAVSDEEKSVLAETASED